MTDPSFATDTGTVSVTVYPVNDNPVAAADAVFTEMGQSVTIGDLLLNDTDVDGDMLTISSVDSYSANMGTITDNGDGTVVYTPQYGFTGSDSFTYYVTDNMGGYSMATVSVTIVDGPMVWMDTQPITIAESSSAPITLHRNRSEGDLIVTLYAYGMSAEPEDYWVGGTAWFADGQTEVEIWPYAYDDNDPDDEIFYVGLMDAGSYTIDWNQYQAELTIEDDDPVTVSLDSTVTVEENNYATVTISRNTTEGELTVNFQAVNQLAEVGDYTLSPSDSVVISDGSWSTTIIFAAEDDADETLTIEVIAPDNGSYAPAMYAWVTIEDREPPVAADLWYFTAQDTTFSGNLLQDDTGNGSNSDPNGDELSIAESSLMGSFSGALTVSSNGDFTYTPNSGFVGDESFIFTLVDSSGLSTVATAIFTAYQTAEPEVDIDARLVKDLADSANFNENPANDPNDPANDNGYLDDDYEETTGRGAWVPVNSDDDDYDDMHKPDKDQDAISVDENDLLPIRITRPSGFSDSLSLQFSASTIWVWRQVNVTTYAQIKSGDTLPFGTEDTLYLFVEGRTKGNTTLEVGTGTGTIFTAADAVAIHVFEVTGPRNVPSYSRYKYEATGAQAGNGKWVDPRLGQEASSIDGTIKDTQEIFWNNAGADFGKARYQPSADYTWGFDINIVKVEIDQSGALFQLKRANQTNNPPVQNTITNSRGRIDSTTFRSGDAHDGIALDQDLPNGFEHLDTPAMAADIMVTRIEGPTRRNTMRGVTFIELGFIQSLEFTDYAVKLDGLPNTFPMVERGGSEALNGQTMLDQITKKVKDRSAMTYDDLRNPASFEPIDSAQRRKPWYDATDVTPKSGATAVFLATTDQLQPNILMGVSDTPFANGQDTASKEVNNVIRKVAGYNMIFDFDLFFAVRTTENILASDKIYTQRAFAEWRFDGSGNFTGGTNQTFGQWQSQGAGVTVTTPIEERHAGDRVPPGVVESEKLVNDKLP